MLHPPGNVRATELTYPAGELLLLLRGSVPKATVTVVCPAAQYPPALGLTVFRERPKTSPDRSRFSMYKYARSAWNTAGFVTDIA